MALVHVHAGISFSSQPNLDELNEAERHARRALEFDPENADARAALANAVGPRGEHQAAIIESRRALAQEPNHAWAYGVIGAALTFDGHADQGLAYLDRSIELDRNDAMAPTREMQRVIALYLSGKYDQAISHGEQVVARHRDMQLVYRWLAAAQGQLELFEPAAKTLGRARAINPEAYRHYSRKLVPWMRQVYHEHLLDGLTKAGWGRHD